MSRPLASSHPALALALLAGLTACTVGPSFRRPNPPAPPSYLAPGEPGADPASAAFAQRIERGGTVPVRWWSTFQSPALDELVREAVAHNPTLAAARASLEEAEELVRAQAGARYPQVALNGGAGRQQYGKEFLGSFFALPAFSYTSVGASVSYNLDYLGGVARSIEERQAVAQYERSEADAAYLALTGSVVNQALTIAAARAQIEAVSELLGEDRDNLRLVRTAFQNGSVSSVDVLTAQTQLATDETLLPPLRQQLDVARHALAVLIGRAPGDWMPPDFELGALKLPQRLPVSLPSQLAHRRPDILAAEAQLHAATAAVGIATANLYPQITLTATGGFQSIAGDELFSTTNTAWTLISGFTAPVFDDGRLRAERRAALDELKASAARYQLVVLESFDEVANLLDALNHDAELLAAQSNALVAAESNVTLARESYSAGNTGVLQVLDAQRQRVNAQLGLLRAEAQRYIDTAQLYLALGGGGPG